MRLEKEEVEKALESGEPFYAKGLPLEPRPDETPEDAYWRMAAIMARDAAPRVMEALTRKDVVMDAPTRTALLMQFWEKLHDRVFGSQSGASPVTINLPIARETSEEWGKRQLTVETRQVEDKK
jgi:hypothetical protein